MAEFRNPNLQSPGGDGGGSGGGDMRGMITIMLLVVLVIFGFDYFKPKQPVTTAPAATPAAVAGNESSVSGGKSSDGATGAGGELAKAKAPLPATPSLPEISAPVVTKTTVENDKYRIVFTNRGAQVENWILLGKQYKDHPDPGGQQLDLVNANNRALPESARDEIKAFGLPLSLFTYESQEQPPPDWTSQLNSALYQVSVSGAASSTGVLKAPCSVTFRYRTGGLDVVKTFRFDASYLVTAEVKVLHDGLPVRALLAWPAGLGDQTEPMHFVNGKFIWSANGRDVSQDAKNVSGNATLKVDDSSDPSAPYQPFEYAAVTDLYFAAAFLPDDPAHATLLRIHKTIHLPSDPSDSKSPTKSVDVIGLAVGDACDDTACDTGRKTEDGKPIYRGPTGASSLRIFAGPKETDLLKTIHATGADGKPDGPTLEPLIQYGSWLGHIAKPLYAALHGLRGLLGDGANNWGWAIIIFTAIFNIVMMPTRFWAMKSSLKMMRIQPKVDAIKKRYANYKINDPKRADMNTEMMALYKAEGVNMYGSCLPMLPQIPLFYAYYRVLYNAVELRQAHWFWLTDLSAPDPMYILPIIIIISMFLTQYITPSPGMDPTQRRMMAFMMPLVFGFMLLHFASGLALYWCTSNVINLALQLGINQSSMGKEMHAIAARKAARKPGPDPGPIKKRR